MKTMLGFAGRFSESAARSAASGTSSRAAVKAITEWRVIRFIEESLSVRRRVTLGFLAVGRITTRPDYSHARRSVKTGAYY